MRMQWNEQTFHIAALALVIFLIVSMPIAIWAQTREDERVWNNGVCRVCGGEYDLFCVTRHYHVYICDQCGHEITTYKPMK